MTRAVPTPRDSAAKVVYHSDTEDADISGGVRVHSATEKGDVSADTLHWENKTKKLTAPPSEQVRLIKDDGTTLVGRGFSGDFLSRDGHIHGSRAGHVCLRREKK